MEALHQYIRSVPNFPKVGVSFKDLSVLLAHPEASAEVFKQLLAHAKSLNPDVIVALESRGFLYGNALALALGKPLVWIRKRGKLPMPAYEQSYQVEYKKSAIALHKDAIKPQQTVLIHDDLLASGASANAAAKLVQQAGGELLGFSFVINLQDKHAETTLQKCAKELFSVITFPKSGVL